MDKFFDPVKGNVAFASAIDCWGFTIQDFAKLLAPKMKIHPKKLSEYLWGDFFMDTAGKFQAGNSG